MDQTITGTQSDMRDSRSEFHIISSETSNMDAVIAQEAYAIVRRAAQPIQPGDTVKAQINRAWAALGRPPHWRVRAAWYQEAGGFSAAAIRDLQDRYKVLQAKRARATQSADLTQAVKLEAAAQALENLDAEFHRFEIDRLRLLSRELRNLSENGPVAVGLTGDPEWQ